MPEGPECRRIGESLAKYLSYKKIESIEILSGRYAKKTPTGYHEFRSALPLKIAGVGVHGKFIYWILEKEYSIWNTLGMTGHWSFEETSHSRVKVVVSGTPVFFNDQRNFGTLKLVKGKEFLIDKLKSLGPDMLADDVEDSLFIERVRKKNKLNVCKVIMDQSILAGVGNYVKADSLWLAKISPHRNVEDCSDEELKELNKSVKKVLRESFKTGGATIRSYKNLEGEIGQYSSKFLVYNRKMDPEGNGVVKEMTPDGRNTHWSPNIQK